MKLFQMYNQLYNYRMPTKKEKDGKHYPPFQNKNKKCINIWPNWMKEINFQKNVLVSYLNKSHCPQLYHNLHRWKQLKIENYQCKSHKQKRMSKKEKCIKIYKNKRKINKLFKLTILPTLMEKSWFQNIFHHNKKLKKEIIYKLNNGRKRFLLFSTKLKNKCMSISKINFQAEKQKAQQFQNKKAQMKTFNPKAKYKTKHVRNNLKMWINWKITFQHFQVLQQIKI